MAECEHARTCIGTDTHTHTRPSVSTHAHAQTRAHTHTHTQSIWGPWRHNLETGLARIRAPGPAHVSLTQKTALHGEKATHSPLTKRIINPDSPRKLGV